MSTTVKIGAALNPDTKSLTSSVYAKLKFAAIAEIEETTQKGKFLLGNAVTNKTTAIVDLQKDYDTILFDW